MMCKSSCTSTVNLIEIVLTCLELEAALLSGIPTDNGDLKDYYDFHLVIMKWAMKYIQHIVILSILPKIIRIFRLKDELCMSVPVLIFFCCFCSIFPLWSTLYNSEIHIHCHKTHT